MRQFVVAAALTVFLVFPCQSYADTFTLKNGREITAINCWEDGDLIKCNLYGQTVGYPKSDVANFQIDAKPEMPTDGFRFDIWQSGITVRDAIKIAEAHDKPMHKEGLISINKAFNPKMCRPYADTANQFYYKDQIFGKWATLNFDFTPTSKRLYRLKIAFSGPDISKTSEFRDRIEAMLREKYGQPVEIKNQIVYMSYNWNINANATVSMRPGTSYIQVTYRDTALFNLAENEKLELVRKGFTEGDKEKF